MVALRSRDVCALVKRGDKVDFDSEVKARLAGRDVVLQDPDDLASNSPAILADDLNEDRLDIGTVARDAVELAKGALLVANLLDVNLQVDLGGAESSLRLPDGADTAGFAVGEAACVVSKVDDSHHGAVLADICLDETMGEGVGAILAALVHDALMIVDQSGSVLRGKQLGGGKAVRIGASDLGEEGGGATGGPGRPQLADLLEGLSAYDAVGLARIGVGLDQLLEVGAEGSSDSLLGGGEDGLVISRGRSG